MSFCGENKKTLMSPHTSDVSFTIATAPDSVTLLGGGPCHKTVYEAAITLAPFLVAADGGAAHALAFGDMPRAVIGDMDSLPETVRATIPSERLHRVSEQDTTDFDKALRHISAPLVIGVGFLGARLDHTLAAMSVLLRHHAQPCILLSEEDAVFALPAEITLDLAVGSRFSLYPLAPATGRSEGLRWPIKGLAFEPLGQIGTSNQVTGPVHLWSDGPGLVAITPRAALAEVARALPAARPHVPATR